MVKCWGSELVYIVIWGGEEGWDIMRAIITNHDGGMGMRKEEEE